jgi:hypothetical protein
VNDGVASAVNKDGNEWKLEENDISMEGMKKIKSRR